MKVLIAPIYRIAKKPYVNIFDIADIIIYYHIKINLFISLQRLLALLLFYKIKYQAPLEYKGVSIFEDTIEIENNYVFIYDINHKYRKYKKTSLPIAKIFFDKFEAHIDQEKAKKKANAVKFIHYLVTTFASKSDKELKKEVQNILQDNKYIKLL